MNNQFFFLLAETTSISLRSTPLPELVCHNFLQNCFLKDKTNFRGYRESQISLATKGLR